MRVRVLRPFGHSPDGILIEPFAVGEVVVVRDDLAAGLITEGFCEPAPEPVRSVLATGVKRRAR